MSFVDLQKENQVLHLRLNRPEAHNALNAEMISELTQIFKSLKKEKNILAVLLKGEGPSFCAGGDLNWMRESIKFNLARNMKDAQKLSEMYEAIYRCPAPVLAYAHGNIMGGGVGFTAVCDIVASETSARYCLSEVKLGLVPSIISPYVLKRIPESAARPLMLTAEIFTSDHAKSVGLVHFVGDKESCEKYLQEKLKLILSNGPQAVQATKALIPAVKDSSWPTARKLTVKTIAERRVSKEGQEGMAAFFEKRSPSWKKSSS